MISVIGREVTSAFWKSSSNASSSALLGARVAELLDPVAGRLLVELGDRGQRRVDLVLGVVAAQLEGDERRLAVLRQLALGVLGVGALHAADVLSPLEPGDDGGYGAAKLGIVAASTRLALDQDALVRLVGEVGVDGLVGAAGLPGPVVLVGKRLGPDRAADEDCQDHEGEPSEDRLLSVLGAPSTGARSEVVSAVAVGRVGHDVAVCVAAGARPMRPVRRRGCGYPHRPNAPVSYKPCRETARSRSPPAWPSPTRRWSPWPCRRSCSSWTRRSRASPL